jgi:hypothetical protein
VASRKDQAIELLDEFVQIGKVFERIATDAQIANQRSLIFFRDLRDYMDSTILPEGEPETEDDSTER